MEIKELLRKTGALLEGHFLLSSGKHSPYYIQCARLFEYPEIGDRIGEMLAEKLEGLEFDTVAAPALGGIHLAYVVARVLKKRNIFAERENGVMKLRRGFVVRKGERVVIVEDVVTTGRSVLEVKELLENFEANVVAIASIINRSSSENPFDRPYHYLIKLDFPIYDPDSCPLCKRGTPIEKPGSRYFR